MTDVATASGRATHRRAAAVGAAGFLLMLGVGSMYGLSGVQAALAVDASIGPVAALLPFGAASVGLAVGSGIAGTVLLRTGARITGMLGALVWAASLVVAGTALSTGTFVLTLTAFAAGGIGVGLTYLTIVATVGPAFPKQPLVGSAIGPLGFASGTAALMVLSSNEFAGAAGARISAGLVGAGAVVAAIALIAGWGLPGRSPGRATVSADATLEERATARPARRSLSLLLFGNAYPGMLLLVIVVPLLASTTPRLPVATVELLIAGTTAALFLGGLIAPTLRRRLGAAPTFIVLLVVRGVALITALLVPTLPALVVTLALILIGHGAGFSILPGVMRSEDEPARFARNYGRVLISWGLAGALGSAVAAASVAVADSFVPALISAIVIAVGTAIVLGVRTPAVLAGAAR